MVGEASAMRCPSVPSAAAFRDRHPPSRISLAFAADEAQAAVVVMAKDLAAQGQITLQEGREDEMVY